MSARKRKINKLYFTLLNFRTTKCPQIKQFARSDTFIVLSQVYYHRHDFLNHDFTVLPVKKRFLIYLLTDSSINNLNGNSVVTMATKVNCI